MKHTNAIRAKTLPLIASLLMLGTAEAHQVWLEQDASGAKLYFGEFGENLRETSPGLLDKFVAPVAQRLTAQGVQPLTVTKTANGFALSAPAAPGESLVAEEPNYPVTERRDGEKLTRSIYVPAARLLTSFAAQPARLALDLVPTGSPGKGGIELQLSYKGKPLPKAKVEVSTPLGWGRELRSDEQGRISVELPWKGNYVFEVMHADTTGGERTTPQGSEKYDRASYVTSVTVTQPEGWPALPAAPAAKPNK